MLRIEKHPEVAVPLTEHVGAVTNTEKAGIPEANVIPPGSGNGTHVVPDKMVAEVIPVGLQGDAGRDIALEDPPVVGIVPDVVTGTAVPVKTNVVPEVGQETFRGG